MAKGIIKRNVLTCPHHGSEFDITTGANLKGPAKKPIQTYEVKIEGNNVFVKVVK
jgi:nitrite reductase/ring-hydroxylating ferredoxin subunit